MHNTYGAACQEQYAKRIIQNGHLQKRYMSDLPYMCMIQTSQSQIIRSTSLQH